jgi:hypothetical protein
MTNDESHRKRRIGAMISTIDARGVAPAWATPMPAFGATRDCRSSSELTSINPTTSRFRAAALVPGRGRTGIFV